MIAIVKYNAGNIKSVQNALIRLGYDSIVTDDVAALNSAEKVIFPGVGEASSAMHYLREHGLDDVIKNLKQPVLGICLGLQLMCSSSEEGETECLGIFPNKVKRFEDTVIVPHMGWNELSSLKGVLFQNLQTESDVYL
jgi:glutamine amidotransferase